MQRVTPLALGALMLAVKCALERRLDRWFTVGLTVLTASWVAASLVATTTAWERFATLLLR